MEEINKIVQIYENRYSSQTYADFNSQNNKFKFNFIEIRGATTLATTYNQMPVHDYLTRFWNCV